MKNNASLTKQYWNQQTTGNNKFFLIVCAFTFFTISFMTVVYFIAQQNKDIDLSIGYLYFFLFALVFSSVFAFLFYRYRRKQKYLHNLHIIFTVLLLLWSCNLTSFDIIQGNSSSILTYILILTSVGIRLPDCLHCNLNFATFVYFYICLSHYSEFESVLYKELINSFLVFILCNIIVLYSNKLHFNHYKMNVTIEKKNKQLYYLAHYDSLTSIPNRRMIMEFFEKYFKIQTENLCCVLIDVDDFKQYNDTYGHIAGDILLTHIATLLQEFAHTYSGMVGRYGGEEFLMILPHYTVDDIHTIMGNIVSTINSGEFKNQISISAGGCMKQSQSSVESMILNADTAMYQVKVSGKNNFLMYSN